MKRSMILWHLSPFIMIIKVVTNNVLFKRLTSLCCAFLFCLANFANFANSWFCSFLLRFGSVERHHREGNAIVYYLFYSRFDDLTL